MANRKKSSRKIILVAILILIIVIVMMMFALKGMKGNNTGTATDQQISELSAQHKEEQFQEEVKDLSEMSEQQRMQFYCAKFFKAVDNERYEDAYGMLYDEYKENYFPNISNFKKYFQDYFPSDFSLSYSNFERLGDIYVLMVNLSDTVNGSYGHNFSLYVVIQETALNEYVLSFSRNSAVGEEV